MRKLGEEKQLANGQLANGFPTVRGLPEDFWERARGASHRLLMIDYDGTLVPFHSSRMEARPSEAVIRVLHGVMASETTRVVVVSGRPVEEVHSLLPEISVEMFGAHGFERLSADGRFERNELSEREAAGLEAARKAADSAGLREHLEIKPASVAVHVRGLEAKRALETEELAFHVFTPIADEHDLECRAFDGGVEIRSRRFHKGLAVEALLRESPDDVFAVYIGDDDTDEDAFRALSGRGMGVRVGAPAFGTAALMQLGEQEDVLPFLKRWFRVTAGHQAIPAPSRKPPRLVLVSNRLPSAETDSRGQRGRPVGGLSLALEAALAQSGGDGLWLGWSGRIREERGSVEVKQGQAGAAKLVGVDLTPREYEAYYNGFCNGTLWPLFHSFPELAELSTWQLEIYRSVNAMFAQALSSELGADDAVWVHDYHLIFLGKELRHFGWRGRMGFFLHIPFPALDILAIVPDYATLLGALFAYDVMGFQTSAHLDNYVYACRRTLGARLDGSFLTLGDSKQLVKVYPVGIDVKKFLPGASRSTDAPRKRLRETLGDRDLIIGVDRLDYTKGLPQRVSAFEVLLKMKPELRSKVSFVQISSPSRTDVKQYKAQKKTLDALVGRINGELGEHNWEPIRYLYRAYTQEDLARFYREARVGLVTPLRDGMNLVAKEYVAAQRPEDPGVLVLSQFAGAAEELTEAVLVNPYLPENIAKGIAHALDMPLEERRTRHAAMLERIKSRTIQKWASDFVSDLEAPVDAGGESRAP